MQAADARRLALSLPEAVERDHHGIPSFRLGTKIFATLPDAGHLHVMLAADDVPAALAAVGPAGEELWWGRKLCGVRLDLGRLDRRRLDPLLRQAWRRVAPKRLLRLLDEPPGRRP
jgi:hypothetical protein